MENGSSIKKKKGELFFYTAWLIHQIHSCPRIVFRDCLLSRSLKSPSPPPPPPLSWTPTRSLSIPSWLPTPPTVAHWKDDSSPEKCPGVYRVREERSVRLTTIGNRYTPFRRPSCQAREEKRKFSPTATSLRRRRQRSRTWATAQRALAEERKWRPKVHQARRDDRFSSRFLSLLLTAAIVPTHPTPLLLCSPLPLSLSDQVWCIQRCDCVNCT